MEPEHLRLDVSIVGSRALAAHDAVCPEIGPICNVRDEPPQRHRSTLIATDLRLLGALGLVPGLALQAVVPLRLVGSKTVYSDLSGRPISLDYESIHHRDGLRAGLGDVQVLLHRGFKLLGLAVGARAGVSIPLGSVEENPYRLGDAGLPHEHIQLGTGTWDPVLALDATAHAGTVSTSLFGSLQAPLYEGRRGYRAGARSQAGLAVSKPFGPVTLRASAIVWHERPERWNGHVPLEDGNQGRTDFYLAPGVTWSFAGEWSLSADLRVRALSHVVDAQLEMPVVLELSLGRLFHLEQGFNEPDRAPKAAGGADVLDVVQNGELAPLEPVPGKWTVFDFWASWCDACNVLDARLRELAARRPGLAIRRVNIVDLKSPIAKRELPGVSLLPHVRLVGAGGAVAYEASGPADELFEEIERRTR